MAYDLPRITGTAKMLLIATAASLLSISAASAATVGTPLPTGLPANPSGGPSPMTQTWMQTGLDASSIAKGATLEFPGSGWATVFRLELTKVNVPSPYRFNILRPLTANQFTVVGETQTFTPEAGIKEYGGYCLPVQRGDRVGATATVGDDIQSPMTSTGADQVSGAESDGAGVGSTLSFSPEEHSPMLLPINAEFRSEAEGCGSAPEADVNLPAIFNLKRSKKCVAYREKGRSKKANIAKKSRSGKKRSCAKQSKITYELSEDATIKATTAVRRDGLKKKKSGAACKKASSKRLKQVRRSRSLKKKYKTCRLFKELGSVESQGKSGANEYIFTGRLAGKKLKPGTYRIGFVATDPSGNVSSGVSTNVRVK